MSASQRSANSAGVRMLAGSLTSSRGEGDAAQDGAVGFPGGSCGVGVVGQDRELGEALLFVVLLRGAVAVEAPSAQGGAERGVGGHVAVEMVGGDGGVLVAAEMGGGVAGGALDGLAVDGGGFAEAYGDDAGKVRAGGEDRRGAAGLAGEFGGGEGAFDGAVGDFVDRGVQAGGLGVLGHEKDERAGSRENGVGEG